MILVLFLCAILFVVILLIILTILSTVKIKINNLEVMSPKKFAHNYKVEIALELFGKIKWLKFRLNENKLKKLSAKMHLERIDIKQLERDLKLADIKEILGIRPKISYMNLALKVGVEDILLTTYLVPIISTFLSVLLPYAVESENIKNVKYKIEPVYNRFFYSVKLDIIIDIKIISALNCAFRLYQNKKIQEQKNKIKCNV